MASSQFDDLTGKNQALQISPNRGPGAKVKLSMLRPTAALILAAAFCLPIQAGAAGGQKVFLIRGFANVFSPGIDQLASELQARGVRTEVSNHLSSSVTAS